jgi:hypothetical protein
LCSAEIIPNSIPKTIAITIAKKASIAVLGVPDYSDTFFPLFWKLSLR